MPRLPARYWLLAASSLLATGLGIYLAFAATGRVDRAVGVLLAAVGLVGAYLAAGCGPED